jgi:hypothetical protein
VADSRGPGGRSSRGSGTFTVHLADELEVYFNEVASGRAVGFVASPKWRPRADVYETEGELVVQLDIAGMAADAFRVELADGLLTIGGERVARGDGKRHYHAMEVQDQALLRYRRDGAPHRPHIVLIGYMPENILRTVSVYRPAYKHESAGVVVKPRFQVDASGVLTLVPMPVASQRELAARVRDRSLVGPLLETDYWVRRAPLAYRGSPMFLSSLARVIYGRYEESGRSRAPYYRDTRGEPFQVTFAILEVFAREAVERGARRAVVVLLPGQEAIEDAVRGRTPSGATLRDSLQAADVEVLDVTPALLGELGDRASEMLFRDYHYDPRANEVVADAIASALGVGNLPSVGP